MIDSRKLRYFVAVCEDLHFARAADRLGVAQSAVSIQIKQLEDSLGVRLINRNKRQPITLTGAGSLFYTEALAALRHIERAEQVGKLAARGVAGVVRLGYVGSAATTGVMTQLLRTFHQTHENVRVEVVAMETPRQLEAISDGELDVGIVRKRGQYPDGVQARVVHSERLLVAFSDSSSLMSRKTLKATDLRGQTFISPQFNEQEGFAETLAQLGVAGGFSAVATHTVNDFVSAVSLAAAGYGIAIVPESIQRFALPGSVFKTIVDFPEQVHLVLAYRERFASPAVRGFVGSALKQQASSKH